MSFLTIRPPLTRKLLQGHLSRRAVDTFSLVPSTNSTGLKNLRVLDMARMDGFFDHKGTCSDGPGLEGLESQMIFFTIRG
jgi:hypothetical protein